MNKHVELVEKWLKDHDLVSVAELKANKDDAYKRFSSFANYGKYAAYSLAYDAADAAYNASFAKTVDLEATYIDSKYNAYYYCNQYKEVTK